MLLHLGRLLIMLILILLQSLGRHSILDTTASLAYFLYHFHPPPSSVSFTTECEVESRPKFCLESRTLSIKSMSLSGDCGTEKLKPRSFICIQNISYDVLFKKKISSSRQFIYTLVLISNVSVF
jgi:hypothetical protein